MRTSNWWMFHGDPAHTGLVTGSGITSKNVARLKLLHDVPIPGPVLSVPAIVDGYVYVGLANSKEVAGATADLPQDQSQNRTHRAEVRVGHCTARRR